jgi:membrane protein DedA with SNARE-associated domain
MIILNIRVLRGPNLWGLHKAIQLLVNFSDQEYCFDHLPGFEDCLRERFPQIGSFPPNATMANALELATAYLAARSGFGHELAQRIETRGGAVARMQQALKEHQVTVLLSMRLIPVLPLLVANVLPALVGVRFWTFAITTFVGIIPADIIYTQLGAGLGAMFARGEHPNLHILFTPEFGLPLLGLAALSLAPLLIKVFAKRKG